MATLKGRSFYIDFQKATLYYFKANDGKRANSRTNSGARGNAGGLKLDLSLLYGGKYTYPKIPLLFPNIYLLQKNIFV